MKICKIYRVVFPNNDNQHRVVDDDHLVTSVTEFRENLHFIHSLICLSKSEEERESNSFFFAKVLRNENLSQYNCYYLLVNVCIIRISEKCKVG